MRYNADKHRLPKFTDDGILPVNKPAGWTSFDVVNFVRARFNIPKVGHCGTLDPAATGLLVLVFNKFTRLSQVLSGQDKVYDATILLGTETDSQDMDGVVTATRDWSGVTPEALREAMAGFVGTIEQVPPMVSAVKKDGKRLYELARQGKEVEREAKPITIHRIDITRIELPSADFTVSCSKGTYIRTLCADIGAGLGCGAVLQQLCRTRSGNFSLDEAVTVETLKTWEQPQLQEFCRDYLQANMARVTAAREEKR
ncbi:MAG: tRNA pseudouridine(55) synthase TruB [Victivallales bacterium]|nr:tRNA pseudouridine(55) synthase TruB [Victivallales bacterium]